VSYRLQDLVLDLPPSVPLDDGGTLDLTAIRRMLLIGIARHADDEGEDSWPAIDLLMEYASCSYSVARSHLRLLRKAGLVEWSARWRSQGGQETNLYRINVERLEALTKAHIASRPDRREKGRERKAAAESARLARRAAEAEHESDAPAGKGAQGGHGAGIRRHAQEGHGACCQAPDGACAQAPNRSSLNLSGRESEVPAVLPLHGSAVASDGDRSGSPSIKANDTDTPKGTPSTDEGSGALVQSDVPARRQALSAAVVAAFGKPVTRDDYGRHGRLLSVLLEHGASPEDVAARVAMWHRRMPPGSTVTTTALAKWYGELASMPDRPVLARHAPADADLAAARSGTVRSARARLADLARAQALDVASRPLDAVRATSPADDGEPSDERNTP